MNSIEKLKTVLITAVTIILGTASTIVDVPYAWKTYGGRWILLSATAIAVIFLFYHIYTLIKTKFSNSTNSLALVHVETKMKMLAELVKG